MTRFFHTLGIAATVACIVIGAGYGCIASTNSGKQGAVELQNDMPITTALATEVVTNVKSQVEAALAHVETSKTINYATDVWPGRVAAVMVPICLLFAWWQAHRHGYWRQRKKRLNIKM